MLRRERDDSMAHVFLYQQSGLGPSGYLDSSQKCVYFGSIHGLAQGKV